MQGQCYEPKPPRSRHFHGGPNQMQNQMWHQHMHWQQHMRPDSRQYRPGGSHQTARSANISSSISSILLLSTQGPMQGMMHEIEPTNTFGVEYSPHGMYPQ